MTYAVTFKEHDRFERSERPVIYQLNLKGFAPAYYYNEDEAISKYDYAKRYLGGCSLRKISYAKMLYKTCVR